MIYLLPNEIKLYIVNEFLVKCEDINTLFNLRLVNKQYKYISEFYIDKILNKFLNNKKLNKFIKSNIKYMLKHKVYNKQVIFDAIDYLSDDDNKKILLTKTLILIHRTRMISFDLFNKS